MVPRGGGLLGTPQGRSGLVEQRPAAGQLGAEVAVLAEDVGQHEPELLDLAAQPTGVLAVPRLGGRRLDEGVAKGHLRGTEGLQDGGAAVAVDRERQQVLLSGREGAPLAHQVRSQRLDHGLLRQPVRRQPVRTVQGRRRGPAPGDYPGQLGRRLLAPVDRAGQSRLGTLLGGVVHGVLGPRGRPRVLGPPADRARPAGLQAPGELARNAAQATATDVVAGLLRVPDALTSVQGGQLRRPGRGQAPQQVPDVGHEGVEGVATGTDVAAVVHGPVGLLELHLCGEELSGQSLFLRPQPPDTRPCTIGTGERGYVLVGQGADPGSHRLQVPHPAVRAGGLVAQRGQHRHRRRVVGVVPGGQERSPCLEPDLGQAVRRLARDRQQPHHLGGPVGRLQQHLLGPDLGLAPLQPGVLLPGVVPGPAPPQSVQDDGAGAAAPLFVLPRGRHRRRTRPPRSRRRPQPFGGPAREVRRVAGLVRPQRRRVDPESSGHLGATAPEELACLQQGRPGGLGPGPEQLTDRVEGGHVEQPAQQVRAVLVLGPQERRELPLRQQDDLEELPGTHPDQAFQLGVGLLHAAEAGEALLTGQGLAIPSDRDQHARVLRRRPAPAPRPLLQGPPGDADRAGADGGLQDHLGPHAGRSVVAAQLLGPAGPRHGAVQGEPDRVEQARLAGAGGAVQQERAAVAERVEVDGLGRRERPEGRDGQPVRPHQPAPTCTRAASSASASTSRSAASAAVPRTCSTKPSTTARSSGAERSRSA